MKAIFLQDTPIPHVAGRIKYISGKNQEHLYAVSGNFDMEFWNQLALENQETFRASGNDREKKMKKKDGTVYTVQQTCVEAREIILHLENVTEKNAQDTADALVAWFKEKYGVECCAAIHNTKENNVHIHLIYSERELMPERQVKIATRNTWIDEKGRQRKAKADILDENGELRSGCRIVKKGEEIYSRAFFDKRTEFSQTWHVDKMKEDCCEWINENLQPQEKYVVFDPYGPYLAQQKIHRGNEKEEEIRRYNRNVQKINAMIDRGEITEEEAYRIKDRIMSSPDRNVALEDAAAEFEESIGEERKDWYSEKEYPEMNEKQMLYRNANIAWNDYKEAKAAGADKEELSLLLKRARHASAEIDRYKRENGLYQDKDYIKLIKSYKTQITRKKAQIARCKNQQKKAYTYFDNYRRKYRDFHGVELDIADEKYWSLKNWWADNIRKTAAAKRELKELKKELQIAKKEFKDKKKHGIDKLIGNAAVKSEGTSKNTLQQKKRTKDDNLSF